MVLSPVFHIWLLFLSFWLTFLECLLDASTSERHSKKKEKFVYMANKIGSIPPSVWGHSGWKFLFSIAYVYPENNVSDQTKMDYLVYFTHLKSMLPCDLCRSHYTEYVKNYPLQFYLHNRESLFHWLLGLHNKSNRNTIMYSSKDAVNRYLPGIDKYIEDKKHKCLDCHHPTS